MEPIKATLHSYKSLATRKQLQITLEVPQEYASEALKMVGVADPSGTQWFALTRLNSPAEQSSGAHAPSTNVSSGLDHPPLMDRLAEDYTKPGKETVTESQERHRTYSRSQKAAILCQDEEFRDWLNKNYHHHWNEVVAEEGPIASANYMLKDILNIYSKKELDVSGPAQDAWDKLLTSYEMRAYAREGR